MKQFFIPVLVIFLTVNISLAQEESTFIKKDGSKLPFTSVKIKKGFAELRRQYARGVEKVPIEDIKGYYDAQDNVMYHYTQDRFLVRIARGKINIYEKVFKSAYDTYLIAGKFESSVTVMYLEKDGEAVNIMAGKKKDNFTALSTCNKCLGWFLQYTTDSLYQYITSTTEISQLIQCNR